MGQKILITSTWDNNYKLLNFFINFYNCYWENPTFLFICGYSENEQEEVLDKLYKKGSPQSIQFLQSLHANREDNRKPNYCIKKRKNRSTQKKNRQAPKSLSPEVIQQSQNPQQLPPTI